MAGGWWLVAGGWWLGKPKKGTGHGTRPNGAKRVATGRDALLRDPAWRVIEGWITNGRGFNDAFIRPIDVYLRSRFIGWATTDRAGARPYHFFERQTPNAERRNAKRTSPISLRCRIEPQELSSAGF